jgi:hypothetical protein
MNTGASAVAAALTFIWVGMVVAISFVEAPLKFRAPGVTLPIGLGIGRLIFRAINTIEVVLTVGIIVALAVGHPPAAVIVAFAIAVGALAVQLAAVRPRLTRRSDAVLAGQEGPRSRAHYGYVGLEVVKLGAMIVGGVLVLMQGV